MYISMNVHPCNQLSHQNLGGSNNICKIPKFFALFLRPFIRVDSGMPKLLHSTLVNGSTVTSKISLYDHIAGFQFDHTS